VHWSDELFRILGFTPGEVAPSFEAVIRACPPQDREYMKKAVQDALSRREPSLTIEHRILRPDGEVRFVQAQI
jgi:PAS domain-containing protein